MILQKYMYLLLILETVFYYQLFFLQDSLMNKELKNIHLKYKYFFNNTLPFKSWGVIIFPLF